MKGKMIKIFQYAGYGVLTLLLTVYFMFLTFPFSQVKDRILPRIEAGLPFRIAVDEIRATPFLGLRLTEIQLFPRSGPGPRFLELPELKLRPALLDLLIGRTTLRLRADLLNGSLSGKVARRKGTLDLAFSWDGVQPSRHPILAALLKEAKIVAGVSGDLKLRMEGNNWINSDGTLSLNLTDGSVENLQVYGFTLPALNGLNGTGTALVGKRKAEVESLSLKSDQLSVSLDGNMDLSPRLMSSRLNFKGRLKLSGALETQYQPMLANFLRKKDAEGYFLFSLRGTLGSPRFSI
jgi:type II secretion system protein N